MEIWVLGNSANNSHNFFEVLLTVHLRIFIVLLTVQLSIFIVLLTVHLSIFISVYLTNLMHKICFTVNFVSSPYMFRAHVLIIRRSKLHYTASGIITPIGGRLVHEKQGKF